VRALDAAAQTVQFDDGSAMHYDWLSINTGPVINRNLLEHGLPGAREFGLFIRPIETFAALWPRVAQMGSNVGLRIAIIGAGATGIEMAMAVRHCLPNAALTLLCGASPPGAAYPAAMQVRLLAALKARRITILQDTAVGLTGQAVQLASGATLACDVPMITTGAQAPPWLQSSGLALDAQGFVAVDALQRSTSHTNVFAAGDVSTRQDRTLPRSGVLAVRAGPALAYNLRASVAGEKPKPHQPPQNSLNLVSCGDRYAIGTWGNTSFEGRWVWHLKNRIDRRFVAHYQDSAP
jgi:NADH dehydrogenase FAD-containing subunit